MIIATGRVYDIITANGVISLEEKIGQISANLKKIAGNYIWNQSLIGLMLCFLHVHGIWQFPLAIGDESTRPLNIWNIITKTVAIDSSVMNGSHYLLNITTPARVVHIKAISWEMFNIFSIFVKR